ncbi:YdiY family protein [Colwelliaceae bacterium MEBiC 14330]
MKSKIAIAALTLLSFSGQYALAEEAATEEKPSLTVSAELGFLFKTGNNKSGDIKAGLNLKHEEGQWINLLAFNALAKKLETIDEVTQEKSFESTDNKWDINGQTNYSLEAGGKNYLYASAFYQQDKFSSFAYQTSFSAGWGRHWWETETSSFFADIGPGVKYDVIRAEPATATTAAVEEYSETAAIVQAQALYTKQINDFVEFKQYFVAKQAVESDKNSYYRSETSLTTKLIESLQFKFSFLVEHDTEVEQGFENTNTETSVTLVYSF